MFEFIVGFFIGKESKREKESQSKGNALFIFISFLVFSVAFLLLFGDKLFDLFNLSQYVNIEEDSRTPYVDKEIQETSLKVQVFMLMSSVGFISFYIIKIIYKKVRENQD
ncbi:MAG: hypothetical protein COB67_00555 [SAR324 cluster bacterium]|uniref:Uncharacterized protein n=1 Tax=SAR324 cluster bacterium TaxID=2024889 RepID=A0A2A4TDE5_9DELT|nr:MAG: hypothetical protein COB67_00555 [SAR324 cluster bacterium]